MVFGLYGWCHREGLVSKLVALGDVVASRFSQSTASVASDRLDHEGLSSITGHGDRGARNVSNSPQNVVLCELRHEAFEACVFCGPSESGLVSKWRLKKRVNLLAFLVSPFFFSSAR